MVETTSLPEPAMTPVLGARVETDLFCPHCGYNLFSLAVLRDERLDILLVRCPECGRFHPPGVASSAGRVWLERLGRITLTLWVFFLIGVMLFHFMILTSAGHGYLTVFTQFRQVSTVVPLAGGGHTTHTSYVRTVGLPEDEEERMQVLVSAAIIMGVIAAASTSLGAFVAVFLWHLKTPWKHLALLWPLASMGLIGLILLDQGSRWAPALDWVCRQLLLVLLIEFLGMELGLLFGRPVTRGLLRLLLPRRLLQHLGFLWEVDGKKTPPVATA